MHGQEMLVDADEFTDDNDKQDVAIIDQPDDAPVADDEPTIPTADDCAWTPSIITVTAPESHLEIQLRLWRRLSSRISRKSTL